MTRNPLALKQLPLHGSNVDSPDPESVEVTGVAGESYSGTPVKASQTGIAHTKTHTKENPRRVTESGEYPTTDYLLFRYAITGSGIGESPASQRRTVRSSRSSISRANALAERPERAIAARRRSTSDVFAIGANSVNASEAELQRVGDFRVGGAFVVPSVLPLPCKCLCGDTEATVTALAHGRVICPCVGRGSGHDQHLQNQPGEIALTQVKLGHMPCHVKGQVSEYPTTGWTR